VNIEVKRPQVSTSSAIYPSLRGKRVVVTGGGSGIGAGIVAGFARQGAEVIFLDVADADSKVLAEQLAGSDIAPVYIRCDLMDLDAVAKTFAQIGPVDVLVNNAGNDDRHKLAQVTPAYWDERMNVNLRHMLFCTQAVAPGMKARGGGAVINFGSISWHLRPGPRAGPRRHPRHLRGAGQRQDQAPGEVVHAGRRGRDRQGPGPEGAPGPRPHRLAGDVPGLGRRQLVHRPRILDRRRLALIGA
jgi:NAD(P)-dependent dehydrogenase (short-subunit alcohol dehydrogenase family)